MDREDIDTLLNIDKKILCFTTSYNRPYYLYNIVNCILNQTYTNFDYYINISIDSDHEEIMYRELLHDFISDSRLRFSFSHNSNQHENYLKPILMAEKNKPYDIFAKIDDDDIYHKNYLSFMIDNFSQHNPDILSLSDRFLIDNTKIVKKKFTDFAGIWNGDKNKKIQFGLPPTYVFNRKALEIIKDVPKDYGKIHPFEDAVWRFYWRENNLNSLIINSKGSIFLCYRHDNNISKFIQNNTGTPQYIDTDNALICLFKHYHWSSYVYLNKLNNRVYNINNEDHGTYTIRGDSIVIDWESWGKETFYKIRQNNIIVYEHR